MMYQNVVDHMNSLVSEWCEQIESPLDLAAKFTVDRFGLLFCNGIALCPAKDICLESLGYDLEYLCFATLDGYEFEIGISWQFLGPPFVSYIRKIAVLYQRE